VLVALMAVMEQMGLTLQSQDQQAPLVLLLQSQALLAPLVLLLQSQGQQVQLEQTQQS
tara:strand:+ start:153 stop:326 length:174 start_codon:yes stop_codon:yes gene_type:complete